MWGFKEHLKILDMSRPRAKPIGSALVMGGPCAPSNTFGKLYCNFAMVLIQGGFKNRLKILEMSPFT